MAGAILLHAGGGNAQAAHAELHEKRARDRLPILWRNNIDAGFWYAGGSMIIRHGRGQREWQRNASAANVPVLFMLVPPW
jgi:hypothetical protein